MSSISISLELDLSGKLTIVINDYATGVINITTANIPDSTDKRYVTNTMLTLLGLTSGVNTGDETAARIMALLTSDTSPLDTDTVLSSDGTFLMKTTYTNVKAFLKTYFDTVYEPTISGSSTTKYFRGDKSFATIPAADVGLGNVLNVAQVTTLSLGGDIPTTSTTFINVADSSFSLKFPVTSGNTYWFRFVIIFSTGTTGRGSAWAISGATLDMCAYRVEWSSTTTVRTIADGVTAYDGTTANATCAATNGNTCIIEGIVRTSANGDIFARMLSANSGNTITAKKFSSLQYKQLN